MTGVTSETLLKTTLNHIPLCSQKVSEHAALPQVPVQYDLNITCDTS